MLRGLDIRNMLIIDRLELEFQPGLNVLTGETGAGKSILLDALGFVLGWRGRAELVRAGADQGEVTAWFDLTADHPAQAVLQDAGFDPSDELLLRRVNTKDGRKTAYVNDRRTSGEILRALSDTLVELHGQHDDRGLLNARGHRALLDDYANAGPELETCKIAWRALSDAKAHVTAAEAKLNEVRAEEDFLRHAMQELDALDPQPGEEQTLDTRRRLMQGAERIREDVSKALKALGNDGADGAMQDASRWLEDVVDQAEGALEQPLAALERAALELSEAQHGVESFLDTLSFNPHELEDAEERLFAIRGLARKHNVQPDDLGEFAQEMRDKLAALDGGADDLKALQQAVQAAQDAFDQAANMLSKKRKLAAAGLDKAMAAELAPLKMERAVFETQIEPAPPSLDGHDHVAFTVATNPGAPAGPLDKIASGGELSRFLLALKVCLTSDTDGLTLIFDEIDRGVGGATADAVGRRLGEIAKTGQVLVVTHSPQVAALGHHHWRVEKRVQENMTTSTVVPLNADERVDEIARMLSGDTITDQARGAARALLAG
ncbi:DNA repair protein RecN [Parasulfitobacter algicola]|uniref:DNA repair protein RecN n=1 Tax=Parasulfitobacter algicola TaxID=2614809 RepID=A0ABX2ITM3_9RHOB|nr:DNA repair protein RecN [Sulfitobacter algicola]NSX54172.1 DNA repair protein RecN [Sulfitobacter algicola]